MTPPIRPEVDPLEALKALKAQAQPDNDPLAQLKALRPQQHDYHAEYQSGALKQRMDAANARDAANLKDEQDSQPGYLERVATHVLNTAQGIPGVEAVEAAAGAVGSRLPHLSFGGAVPVTATPSSAPMSYRQSLDALRGNTKQIGNKVSIAEHVVGALPLAAFLPASPVKAGAAIGVAEGLLSADPDQSVAGRAGRGVLGAAGGALAGKAGETLVSGGRALLAKGAAKNLVARDAARAASAKLKYGAAIAEGKGKEATDAVKEFLHETGIEEIVDELKQTRPFQTVAHDGPEMLDAVYKVLSDRAASLKKGLDAVTPNRPNIGRFRLQDTKAAQGELLGALKGTPEAPGPMPSYPAAVQDYAQRSGDIEGVQRGYEGLRLRLRDNLPTARNLLRKSPEALQEWAKTAAPSQIKAASEGALGAAKAQYGAKPVKSLLADLLMRGPTAKVGPVLRDAADPTQALIDRFVNGILLSAAASRR